jgi:hypothetical protein
MNNSHSYYMSRPDRVEESQDRMQRLLEESPGYEIAYNQVTISIRPMGPRLNQAGAEVSLSCNIDVRGGVEMLRWQLDRMLSDILEAKSKGFEAKEKKDKERKYE